jgi:hypothetical protein
MDPRQKLIKFSCCCKNLHVTFPPTSNSQFNLQFREKERKNNSDYCRVHSLSLSLSLSPRDVIKENRIKKPFILMPKMLHFYAVCGIIMSERERKNCSKHICVHTPTATTTSAAFLSEN